MKLLCGKLCIYNKEDADEFPKCERRTNMSFTIIQVLFGQLILPLVFIISLWKTSFNSKLAWILHSAVTLMMVTWVFLGYLVL